MFIKEQIDILTSLLILRDIGKFNARLKALIKTSFIINRIKKAKEYFSTEGSAILTAEKSNSLLIPLLIICRSEQNKCKSSPSLF